MRTNNFILVAVSTTALGISQAASGAGFAVSAQSAFGMGNSYAGNAAVAGDASTALTNPAGIFELKNKAQFAVSGAATVSSADYTDRGSLSNVLFGAEPVGLAEGVGPNENLSGVGVSPGIYYARTLNDKWAVGFAFSVPFATASDYGDDWVGRYHAVESEVTAFDINPSFAYKVNDKFSVGGGLSVQIATAKLTSKLDSGATCLGIASQAGLPVTSCSDLGLLPNNPNIDTDAELDGTGTELTFNLGALFKPREGTKIGVTYRHGADHSLDGDADFTATPALEQFLAAFPEESRAIQDTGDSISADLPAIFDISIAQQATEQLELLATVKWTQWSSFDELVSEFDNPAQPDSSIAFNWDDSVMVSAGANFEVNEKLTVRAGLAYDQTPIPDATSRSPRGATDDRYWYSIGGSYDFTPRVTAHFGYARVEIDESAIDNSGNPGNPTLRGSYEWDVNLLAFQLNWNFM